MPTTTIIGQIATARGLAEQYDLAGEAAPFTLPASKYRHLQAAHIPVRIMHDEGFEVGTVEYLERSKADGLLVLMRADVDIADLLDDGPWYLSGGVNCRPTGETLEYGHGVLHEVSLVRKPAAIGTQWVRWCRSDSAGQHPHGMPLRWHNTWDRAHEAIQRRSYKRSDNLFIVDLDPLDVLDTDSVRTATLARAAALPPTPTPSGTLVVNYYGERLTGEAAQRALDAFEANAHVA